VLARIRKRKKKKEKEKKKKKKKTLWRRYCICAVDLPYRAHAAIA